MRDSTHAAPPIVTSRAPRVLAAVTGALLCAGLAAPLSAAPAEDARARGERLFYDHAFGATPASIPLKVYEVLPGLDPAYAPEALERRYGLLSLPGRALPVGFVTAQALGVDRLSFNCALCHTGRQEGAVVPGLPNRKLRIQDFEEDFARLLARPGFTAEAVMPLIAARHPELSTAESMQIRLWLAVAKQQAPSRTPSPHRAGPGRFDLLGSFKKRLGLPVHDFNAQADIASLFGTRSVKRYPRDGALGGDQDLVRYLIVRLSGDNAPLVNGQVPGWVKDLNSYLASLTPPRYPYPVDAAKAHTGRAVFRNTCTPCHGTYDAYDERHPNRVIPQAVIGTDPNRVRVWDAASIAFVNKDPIMKRLELQPGVGMLPPSLRGVWATSPYLHNGSVPTLMDVLGEPAARPARFYRGGDDFDRVRVGVAAIAQPSSSDAFLFDTAIPGNGNQGHPFGVPLTAVEREAVVEYLKTL